MARGCHFPHSIGRGGSASLSWRRIARTDSVWRDCNSNRKSRPDSHALIDTCRGGVASSLTIIQPTRDDCSLLAAGHCNAGGKYCNPNPGGRGTEEHEKDAAIENRPK